MRSHTAWSRRRIPLPALVLAAVVWQGAPMALAEQQDAEPAEGGPMLALDRCVEIALQGSLTLAISQSQRSQASQDVKEAWAAFLPDVTLSRTYYKIESTDFDYRDPFTGAVSDFKQFFSQTTNQARSNLNVFSGFSKISGLKSARNSLKAAAATESHNRELVVQYVSSAYYNLLRYERLLVVANDSRDLAARELERSETYFRLGSVAKSDVLQARVRLEQTRLEVVQAENAVAQAFADLAYAMNQPLAERFEIDRSPLDTDFAVELLDDLYAEALQNRLDLKSQEYTVAARKNDATTAGGNLWPRADVFVQYQLEDQDSAFQFGADRSSSFAYGYSITWSIFDKWVTFANRSQARASARIAQYNLDQYRLDAQLEIRRLYNTMIEARERVGVSRETIIQAQEELRLAQERFRVGAGTTLDRINAEVNLSSARADEVQAICDFLIAATEIDVAVGRSLRQPELGS